MSILFLNNHNDLLVTTTGICLSIGICMHIWESDCIPMLLSPFFIRLCMALMFYENLPSERQGILKRNVVQCDVGTVNTLS